MTLRLLALDTHTRFSPRSQRPATPGPWTSPLIPGLVRRAASSSKSDPCDR